MDAADFLNWRIDHKLTRTELAARLGVDVSAVNRWENGKRRIPPYLPLALKSLEVSDAHA
jgi:transcriptional regulator with XRE-family HTH domain